VGEIDVTTSSAHPLPEWTLKFSYRSDQILRVWRDGWLPHGRHSATVVAAERAGAQPEGRPPGTPDSAIMIVMSGSPGPPDSCTINGQPCRLG
ncbi:MAG: cellulose binding domain-containing protein, partial [Actinobacteria bacterium]|nr:cellulose binding domain-containing protein [Actinomycetota bacterium]